MCMSVSAFELARVRPSSRATSDLISTKKMGVVFFKTTLEEGVVVHEPGTGVSLELRKNVVTLHGGEDSEVPKERIVGAIKVVFPRGRGIDKVKMLIYVFLPNNHM